MYIFRLSNVFFGKIVNSQLLTWKVVNTFLSDRSGSALPGGWVGALVSMQPLLWDWRIYKESTGAETLPTWGSTLSSSCRDQMVWWAHRLSPEVFQLVNLHTHCKPTVKCTLKFSTKAVCGPEVRKDTITFFVESMAHCRNSTDICYVVDAVIKVFCETWWKLGGSRNSTGQKLMITLEKLFDTK
jgi:hypothetical protein